MGDVIFKLNKELHVSNQGHILYVYESQTSYIDNACMYILTATELNQTVLLIDTVENWNLIQRHLHQQGNSLLNGQVHFCDAQSFYSENSSFCCDAIVRHFQTAIEQIQKDSFQIRTWANVRWLPAENIFQQLIHFETQADQAVKSLEILSVCAYDAEVIPASMMLKLQRSHGYVMTDTEFFVSPLYAKQDSPVVFPSLSEQQRIQTEMELYKQKLDFAHVVSHEVRNPLTVIKAYCLMLLHQPESLPQHVSYKLAEIVDYVDVIDQEITYIIHTEQMLSNDQLWEKDWFDIVPVLKEVAHFMSIKAKTQNQQFEAALSVASHQRMYASKVGLKLIISNLLSNAIKYNEENSTVRFTAVVENDFLTLCFEDQGMGMTPKQLESLFVKYSNLNHDKGGQGIGLYMVKKLLDDAGGTIHFESAVGKGTTVHVKVLLETKV